MKRAPQTEAVHFDQSVAAAASGDGVTQASLSPQDFGLRRWKEYAILRSDIERDAQDIESEIIYCRKRAQKLVSSTVNCQYYK